MLDVQGLPPQFRSSYQIFRTSADANSWQEWLKPRGISMVSFAMAGGAGGGGAGLSGANPSARGGGAGGGSAALSVLTLPAIFVPNVLWVQVGKGGAGGASSGNAGASGLISVVASMPPDNNGVSNTLTTPINIYLRSEATAAGGGGAGTSTTSAGGSAGAVSTTGNGLWMAMGAFVSFAGQIGAAGGSGAGNNAGSNATPVAVSHSPFCNGAGGGSANSTNNNGGRMTGSSYIQEGQQGGQAAVNAGLGPPGQTIWNPFTSTAGAGGAGITAGTGGNGGFGGVGSGGGGGGAGVTGGAGGNGGDGIVIITCW